MVGKRLRKENLCVARFQNLLEGVLYANVKGGRRDGHWYLGRENVVDFHKRLKPWLKGADEVIVDVDPRTYVEDQSFIAYLIPQLRIIEEGSSSIVGHRRIIFPRGNNRLEHLYDLIVSRHKELNERMVMREREDVFAQYGLV
jgi:hypothetical protein